MKKKYKVLIGNMGVFAVGNLVVKLFSFFLMPLYTSILTTEQYGISEILNNAVELILPVATLCIVDALYRYSIDDDVNYNILFTNTCLVAFTGTGIVSVATFIVGFGTHYKYVFDFLILFIATVFYQVTTQFARGLGYTKRFAFYGVMNAFTLCVSNIILLFIFKGGVKAYLSSFSIAHLLTAIIAFISSKEYQYFNLNQFNKSLLREMLKFSIPNVPNIISWWINNVSDRYILLFFTGAETVGLYTAASKLPAMINVFSSVFQQAWQYSTAKEIENEENEFFNDVFRIYSHGIIVLCALLVACNKVICSVILKADFYNAWNYSPLLLFAATLGSISTYFGAFYGAKKSNTMAMISTLTGALVNIAANFFLIPSLGGIGAAIATAISYFIVMVIRMIDITKKVNIFINYKIFVFQLIILIISVVSSTIYNNFISIVFELICMLLIFLSDRKLVKLYFQWGRNHLIR